MQITVISTVFVKTQNPPNSDLSPEHSSNMIMIVIFVGRYIDDEA
jgi:hypothetical protein